MGLLHHSLQRVMGLVNTLSCRTLLAGILFMLKYAQQTYLPSGYIEFKISIYLGYKEVLLCDSKVGSAA